MKKGILFIALGLFAYTMLSCDPVNGNGDGGMIPKLPKIIGSVQPLRMPN